MKVLILNEMLTGNSYEKYSPFHAIEAENLSEENLKLLESLHGQNLTNPNEKQESLLEKYLNLIYNIESSDYNDLSFRNMIKTDSIKTAEKMGPYDKVFHIVY